MELIDVDAVQAQSFETSLDRLAKVRGSCIVSPLVWTGTIPTSLSSDHETSRGWKQSLGNQFFTHFRAVGIPGIDKIDTELNSPSKNFQLYFTTFSWHP